MRACVCVRVTEIKAKASFGIEADFYVWCQNPAI